MREPYRFDVFLSHSSKDKPVVRALAERMRNDGVRVWFDEWEILPGDNIPAKIEEGLEQSTVLVLCMSANAFGSDWAQLEAGTFRFRDPLNKGRRFMPLRLDDTPPKGSLATFLYIDFRGDARELGYGRLLNACLNTGTGAVAVPVAVEVPQFSAGQRKRAVRLLETFFAGDVEESRLTIFNQAFDGASRNPFTRIVYSGSAADFAVHAVDTLLAFGGTGRGRHSLSLLLAAMAVLRGRQSNPDYYDLQRELDKLCALPTRAEELAYLARVIQETEKKARLYSPLHGMGALRRKGSADILLEPWDEPDIALLRHNPRKRESMEKPDVRSYDDILTAFGDVRRAALLGAPGSGKSTTLRRLAVELAQQAQKDAKAPLPLLAALGEWRGDESLAEFLAEKAPEVGWAVEALSRAGRLVLLLDGLNEVPTAARASKASGVRKVVEQLLGKAATVVSCRREDYTGELDLGLDTLTLEPLSPQRIRAALRQWVTSGGAGPELAERIFWEIAGDEGLARALEMWVADGGSEDEFWTASEPRRIDWQHQQLWRRHILNPRNLVRLAANPFMLTMLYQVRVDEGSLPRNRGDLFDRFIRRLLSREGLLVQDKTTKEWRLKEEGRTLLDGLRELAWGMQTERIETGSGDLGVLTVVSRETAVGVLGNEGLLKRALDSTLLEGSQELRFRHQLLQEYFTARALQTRWGGREAAALWPGEKWWERSGWEETAVLLAGLYADDCTGVIRWLVEAQPEVAAQCVDESGAEISDKAGLLRELQGAWLPRLLGEPTVEGRAAIGRALGRLGLDNRKGVGLRADGVPDIDWVEIHGGEYIYQEEKKRRRVERFYMGRYPVTNAQYQVFLEAGDGYADDRWWKGMDAPERTPAPPEWTEGNHPRETVSWWEVMAFCRWLGTKLGYEVRLPTEWQWERAARGMNGRAYPWGEDYVTGRANIDETWGEVGPHHLGRTSAVGIYPLGASAEGVMDLSGDVWEWCLNEYGNPERTGAGGREWRVLRGGSWVYYQEGARAGYRSALRPVSRNNGIGFRVVCSSPIR
ncbi:MAG: SUMF1/EgtB/PvdO family nonheme iron enzyme [Bryobacteraceae bacterium]